MKLNPFVTCLVLVSGLGPLPAGATGGSSVLNGAGIVEQNIFYAYNSLPQAIENCLELCGLNAADAQALSEIRKIAIENPATSGRILYVAEKDDPGFDLEVGQAHRLAATGLTASVPIYWNTDQLYNPDGSPALSVPEITAIWVHELGHQTGRLDHGYLDQLGSKVRLLLEQSPVPLDYSDTGISLRMQIINYQSAGGQADLYLSDGVQSIKLDSFLRDAAACAETGEIPIGWTLSNGHWVIDGPMYVDSSGVGSLLFGAWMDIACLNGTQLHEERDYKLVLDLQLVNVNGTYRFKQVILTSP